MRWLFYSPQDKDNALARLAEITLEMYVPPENMDRIYGIELLKEYFQRPQVSPSHVFLVLNSKEELSEISEYRKIILDMKCLIGLPSNCDQEFVFKAFEFHPRYVARLPGDRVLLELVLQKITGGPSDAKEGEKTLCPSQKPGE